MKEGESETTQEEGIQMMADASLVMSSVIRKSTALCVGMEELGEAASKEEVQGERDHILADLGAIHRLGVDTGQEADLTKDTERIGTLVHHLGREEETTVVETNKETSREDRSQVSPVIRNKKDPLADAMETIYHDRIPKSDKIQKRMINLAKLVDIATIRMVTFLLTQKIPKVG